MPDLADVTSAVARAVRLEEGPPGVRTVLQQLAQKEPVSVRALSRASGLPVPVVAAICNELRAMGLVSDRRPAQLTDDGRALTEAFRAPSVAAGCDVCDGRGVVVPSHLEDLLDALEELEDEAPSAAVELDQAHCTPETKMLRALLLQDAGVLAGARVLLAGDDDLLSLTIGMLAGRGVVHAPEEIVVVDVDERLAGFVRERAEPFDFPVEFVVHDLRKPLPPRLTGRFAVAFTDPPYTVAGAALFLSRCVEGMTGAPGEDVFFAFGPKGPDVSLQVQRLLARMGLVTHRMTPSFNDYIGAGILGGTSDLYHLVTSTAMVADVAGDFAGDIYTGDRARGARRYECATCGAEYLVGPGADFPTIAGLKERGCAACSGVTFRPGALASDTTRQDAAED